MINPVPPERKNIRCTWSVCTVCIPRESYYWMQDWIEHHLKAGASQITIYDNTGSMSSSRGASVYSSGYYQRNKISKRGEKYGELTKHLTDEKIKQDLKNLANSYDGRVEIIDWQPRDSNTNEIIHGQVEAYCDYIRRYRDVIGWGLFIDVDEYIYCRPGLSINDSLTFIENILPSASALQLLDWQFECRWGEEGPKDIGKHQVHHSSRHDCGKMLVRLLDASHANVHLDWKLKDMCTRLTPHPLDLALCHYNTLPEELEKNGEKGIFPREFLNSGINDFMKPRFTKPADIICCGASALDVNTTYL